MFCSGLFPSLKVVFMFWTLHCFHILEVVSMFWRLFPFFGHCFRILEVVSMFWCFGSWVVCKKRDWQCLRRGGLAWLFASFRYVSLFSAVFAPYFHVFVGVVSLFWWLSCLQKNGTDSVCEEAVWLGCLQVLDMFPCFCAFFPCFCRRCFLILVAELFAKKRDWQCLRRGGRQEIICGSCFVKIWPSLLYCTLYWTIF